jgi:hypothetical protein
VVEEDVVEDVEEDGDEEGEDQEREEVTEERDVESVEQDWYKNDTGEDHLGAGAEVHPTKFDNEATDDGMEEASLQDIFCIGSKTRWSMFRVFYSFAY